MHHGPFLHLKASESLLQAVQQVDGKRRIDSEMLDWALKRDIDVCGKLLETGWWGHKDLISMEEVFLRAPISFYW